MLKDDNKKTAWEGKVGEWYKKSVGIKGNYYHEKVILPGVLRLLEIKAEDKILDLACGQGIFGRQVSNLYLGVDLAKTLIDEAKKLDENPKHRYWLGDVSKELKSSLIFDKGIIVLALQNIKKPFGVIRNFNRLLRKGGELVIVINHPAFRVPKHSDWEVKNDKQYRVIENYMSPLEIPIETSPFDKKDNQISYSYHYPLSAYFEMLASNGFMVEKIEEWISPKKSEGPMAIIEDKARREFPLFLAIKAIKNG